MIEATTGWDLNSYIAVDNIKFTGCGKYMVIANRDVFNENFYIMLCVNLKKQLKETSICIDKPQ